jgi:hypothetical protein
VRTGGGLGSIGSGHFVQEPVRWRTEALLVLLTVGIKFMVSFKPFNSELGHCKYCSLFREKNPLSETQSQIASRDKIDYGV